MNSPLNLAELQGIYGAYSVPEHLLQTIWARGDFIRTGLKTLTGSPLEILSLGHWNHLEGPDFRDAEILLDGVSQRGDVELHLYEKDWNHHGHHRQSDYRNVILHVVLFPSPATRRAASGCQVLCLLPCLNEDMESLLQTYALAGDFFTLLDPPEDSLMQTHMALRWKSKYCRLQSELTSFDCEQLLHIHFLGALGGRRNRALFRRIGRAVPAPHWQNPNIAEQLWTEWGALCTLPGLRPASHPRRRWQQYQALVQKTPNWPKILLQTLENWRQTEEDQPLPRLDFLEEFFSADLVRAFWIDVFIPIMAARAEEADISGWGSLWSSLPAGLVPDKVRQLCRRRSSMGPQNKRPITNGEVQGILGWLIEKAFLAPPE
jgi:hypothetical protein